MNSIFLELWTKIRYIPEPTKLTHLFHQMSQLQYNIGDTIIRTLDEDRNSI
jgi:hypothetical protein